MKKNRGITLIALIITIIVMLILVAVSISVALNTGLFKSASDATKNWKTAQEEESNMPIEIGGKKYNSIEEYLNGGIKEEHNWKRTGDTLTCGHCNKTYTIGDVVDYTDSGAESTSITAEKAGGYTGTSALVNSGVKVASLKLNNNFKIAKASGPTQPTKTQTIQKDENITWIVLGAEDSNKNGTNETLLLTTKEPTTGTIVLYGAAGYNNCIEEINRMCKEIYGTDARGMTIEDVNACLQYTAPAGMCRKDNSGTWVYYTVPEDTKISDLGLSYGDIWTDIQNKTYQEEDETKKYFTPSCPEGTTDASVLGNEIVNGYNYRLSSDGTYLESDVDRTDTSNKITSVEKNVIFGESKEYRYWLASRGVVAGSWFAYFGPGSVNGGSADSCSGLFGSSGGSGGVELPLRCVVSLRSDIPAVAE